MDLDAEPPPAMQAGIENPNRPLDASVAAAATAAAQLQYQQHLRRQKGNRGIASWGEGGGGGSAVTTRVDAPHTLETGPLFLYAPMPGVCVCLGVCVRNVCEYVCVCVYVKM